MSSHHSEQMSQRSQVSGWLLGLLFVCQLVKSLVSDYYQWVSKVWSKHERTNEATWSSSMLVSLLSRTVEPTCSISIVSPPIPNVVLLSTSYYQCVSQVWSMHEKTNEWTWSRSMLVSLLSPPVEPQCSISTVSQHIPLVVLLSASYYQCVSKVWTKHERTNV